MKSKTSFFDPTLLKKNVSRFAPAWAILLVGMLLAYPMTLMRTLDNFDAAYRKLAAAEHLRSCVNAGVVVAFFAALFFAALVFKYLHTTRAAYMMHAFPMTRGCMFVTNTVSGLLFYLVPALLTALCCLVVLAARGVSGCDSLVWGMLLRWILQYLFFYGLAVFTMHISGRTVIAVLSYAALNFVLLLIPLLILILVKRYFYGFDYEIPESMLRLSPAVALLALEGDHPALTAIYAAVGAVLLILAWVHYRVRQVERAGDAMVYPWARIAFRLVFTLCCALGLGYVLAAFFGLLSSGSVVFLPYALLGCFLGWFGSTMMLERTIKVFKNKKIWLGFAVFAGVLILFVAVLKYDLLGFQHRVPETADVEAVDVWTDYNRNNNTDRITLTDAAQIDAVRDVHTHALKGVESQSRRNSYFWDGYAFADLHIEYRLSDGTTLRRCYELAEDEDIQTIRELYADPAVAAAWYDKVLPKSFRNATLFSEEAIMDIDVDGSEYYTQPTWECRDLSALRAAMIADAAAGRLPVMNDFGLINGFGEGKNDYSLELYSDSKHRYEVYMIPETATETLALFAALNP